jgi:hypothetical protein
VAKWVKIWRCTNCRHDYCARDERRSCPNCWTECKQERIKLGRSISRPIKGDIEAVIARFEEDNLMAARIILADPQKYSGLPQEWARTFLTRHNWEKSRLMRALTETPRKRSARAVA